MGLSREDEDYFLAKFEEERRNAEYYREQWKDMSYESFNAALYEIAERHAPGMWERVKHLLVDLFNSLLPNN